MFTLIDLQKELCRKYNRCDIYARNTVPWNPSGMPVPAIHSHLPPRTSTNDRPNVQISHDGQVCTAAILNKYWLITAGHCCVHENTTIPLHPSSLSFCVRVNANSCGTATSANTVVLHPNYDTELNWDVCLVQVNGMQLENYSLNETQLPGHRMKK